MKPAPSPTPDQLEQAFPHAKVFAKTYEVIARSLAGEKSPESRDALFTAFNTIRELIKRVRLPVSLENQAPLFKDTADILAEVKVPGPACAAILAQLHKDIVACLGDAAPAPASPLAAKKQTKRRQLHPPSPTGEKAPEGSIVMMFDLTEIEPPLETAIVESYKVLGKFKSLDQVPKELRAYLLYGPFVAAATKISEKRKTPTHPEELMNDQGVRDLAARILSDTSGIDIRSAKSFYAHVAKNFREKKDWQALLKA